MVSNKYELEKQKNEDFLKQLVAGTGKPLARAPVVVKPVKVTKPRAPAKKRSAPEEVYSRRTSSRLTVYAEDGTKLSREERQAEQDAKQEREEKEAEERKALKDKIKHETKPVVPLLSVNGSGSATTLRKLFLSLANPPTTSSSTSPSKLPKASSSTSISIVPNEDTPTSRQVFAKKVSSYHLDALIKVVPNRVYSLTVHPSMELDVVFVGDKKGCIGIWDRTVYDKSKVKVKVKKEVKDEEGDEEMLEEEGEEGKGRHWYYQAHGENSIACIGVSPTDPGSVYSAAYDCTLRKTNFITFQTEEVLNADVWGGDNLIHSFGFSPDGNEIWASDSNGGLMYRDLREPIETARRWVIDPSGHKVGCISINPANPFLAVSAHLKREMRIWDLRKLLGMPPDASIQKIQSCVLSTYTHGKACTSAYFDSTGTRIISTSYDDRVRVWELNPLDIKSISNDFDPIHSLKHDNQTGAYLSVFKAQWLHSPLHPPSFSIGNMKQYIDVYTATDGHLVAQLSGAETTSVPAVTASHPFRGGRLYGATAAGKLVCYT